MDLASLQAQLDRVGQKHPPVEKWNPDFCGDINLTIKHDGQWFYMGTPIGRASLVKLFASVLKKEDDNYFLVTPVEKVGIEVVDVPFLVTQWREENGYLIFTTNVDDEVIVSAEHPVVLARDKHSGDTLPYAYIRRNLMARLHQNVFYQLADTGNEVRIDGEDHLTLVSGDYRFSLGML